MVVVPADAVVLVSSVAEYLEDLADPASLPDPVALHNHQVANVRSGRTCACAIADLPSLSPSEQAYPPPPPASVLSESWLDVREPPCPGRPYSLLGDAHVRDRCPNDHEFEVIHSMGAPPPTACEVCGAAPVSRVFYPISTSFTGTGFYSTDYGRGEQKPESVPPASDKKSDKRARKTDEKTTKKPEPE